MKYLINTAFSVQKLTPRIGEAGLLSANQSSSSESTLAAHSEQSAPAPEHGQGDLIWVFFAVGFAINIAMITAYFIWAYKHWTGKGEDDEGE